MKSAGPSARSAVVLREQVASPPTQWQPLSCGSEDSPRVPDDDREPAGACPETWEERRNRTMIALLADSGLRKEELGRLRWRDLAR